MSTIDTQLFQLVASSALQGLLDKIVGPKTLILTPSLAGPLGLVTEVGLLKNNHAVTKMFWLEPGPLNSAERNVVYLCRPEVKWMKILADQIKSTPRSHNHIYHLLCVPRITSLCTTILSDAGVLGSIEIQDFQLGFIPLERDLLSLEYEDVWKKINLDGDVEPIYDTAKALMTLQRAFGTIPRIIGKGDSARKLVDLLKRFHREQNSSSSSSTTTSPKNASSSTSTSTTTNYLPTATIPLANGTIDSMIVLDRQTDMVSALCTQLTYQGLVDEMIGIKNAHVDVDPNLLNPPPAASTSTPQTPSFGTSTSNNNNNNATPQKLKRKHHLSRTLDPLFSELCDQNFAVVGTILNRTARRLNEDYEKRHEAKTPKELRAFVGQLGGLQNEHQALRLHTSLTEQIMTVTSTEEFNTALEVQQNLVAGVDLSQQEQSIRELINREVPLKTVLRLLCLYSLVTGGIKLKVLEEFKREILQTYGYDHTPLLISLQHLNLLTRPTLSTSTSLLPSRALTSATSSSSSSSSKPAFVQCRKPLRLIVDDIDEQEPLDISYVFSGYAPLSCRLVQCVIGSLPSGGNGTSAGGGGIGGEGNGVGNQYRSGGEASSLNGWKGLEDVVRSLPGVTFDEWQVKEDLSRRVNGEIPTTVVCFLGGITYAEIAAIRFLNRQLPRRNLLIVTTSTVTGGSLLTSLMHPATRNKPSLNSSFP